MTHLSGDVLPEREFGPATRTDFVRYAGASGDFNPIHHVEQFARDAGFSTVFSPGMLQAGYLAAYVTDRFGASQVRRFREQVWPGDVLTCRGTVAATRTTPDGEQAIDLELVVTNQRGAQAIVGFATVVV